MMWLILLSDFPSQRARCAKCHDHKFDPIPTKTIIGWAIFAPFFSVFPWQKFENQKGIKDGARYQRLIKADGIRVLILFPRKRGR